MNLELKTKIESIVNKIKLKDIDKGIFICYQDGEIYNYKPEGHKYTILHSSNKKDYFKPPLLSYLKQSIIDQCIHNLNPL
jgi:hypothetical protein